MVTVVVTVFRFFRIGPLGGRAAMVAHRDDEFDLTAVQRVIGDAYARIVYLGGRR